MAVEGVDQLETYFGAYLPQFFYAVLAPLTLFAVLNSISCLIYISSLSFLFTVTMIPISFVKIDDAKRPALHIAQTVLFVRSSPILHLFFNASEVPVSHLIPNK